MLVDDGTAAAVVLYESPNSCGLLGSRCKQIRKHFRAASGLKDTAIPWPLSEVGRLSPPGKSFRFMSCMRARGAYVRADPGEILCLVTFSFSLSGGRLSLFPRLPSAPNLLSSFSWLYQLALSVYWFGTDFIWVVHSSAKERVGPVPPPKKKRWDSESAEHKGPKSPSENKSDLQSNIITCPNAGTLLMTTLDTLFRHKVSWRAGEFEDKHPRKTKRKLQIQNTNLFCPQC